MHLSEHVRVWKWDAVCDNDPKDTQWKYVQAEKLKCYDLCSFATCLPLPNSPNSSLFGNSDALFDFWHLLTKYLQISDWSYLMWLCWTSWQNSSTSSKFSPMMPQLMAQCLGRSSCGCILPLFFPGLSPLLTTAPRDSQTTSWDSNTSEKLQRRGNRKSFHLAYGCWIWELPLKVEQGSCPYGLNLDSAMSHLVTSPPLAELTSCTAAGEHLPRHVRASDPRAIGKGPCTTAAVGVNRAKSKTLAGQRMFLALTATGQSQWIVSAGTKGECQKPARLLCWCHAFIA